MSLRTCSRPAGPPSTRDQRAEVAEQALQVGREAAFRSISVGDSSRAAGRSCVISGLVLLANAVRRSRGRPTLARKVGKTVKSRQRCVAAGGGLEDPVRVLDQVAQLAVALGERVEDHAGVAHQRCVSPLCSSRIAQQVVGVLGERGQVAERVVEACAAARSPRVPAGRARCGSAAGLGSNARKISSSWTVSATCPRGSVPPSASILPWRGCRASARRRSRRAASSGAGSRACRSAAARTRGSIWIRRRSGVSAFGSLVFTLPTGTPEIRTSASWASCVASGKSTVHGSPPAAAAPSRRSSATGT